MTQEPIPDNSQVDDETAGDAEYAQRLEAGIRDTSVQRSWEVTVVLVLIAGPMGVLGALSGGRESWLGVLTAVLFAPLLEEIMKVIGALWVVQRRPYWFRSRTQIILCALGGGFGFAVIENLLYLNVYVTDPSPEFVRWRWTVCVAMHTGFSLIIGLGLAQIWQRTIQTRTPPDLGRGSVYFIIAIALHASYNAFAAYVDSHGL